MNNYGTVDIHGFPCTDARDYLEGEKIGTATSLLGTTSMMASSPETALNVPSSPAKPCPSKTSNRSAYDGDADSVLTP